MWLSRTMVAPSSKSRGIPLPGVVYSRFCICSEYLRVLPSSPQQSSPKTVGPPGTSVASKMHNLNIPEGCRSCSDLLCDQNHWIYKQFQRYRSSLIHCRLDQVMAWSHAYLKYEDHSHRCSHISAQNWERSLCTTGPAPPLPALGITCASLSTAAQWRFFCRPSPPSWGPSRSPWSPSSSQTGPFQTPPTKLYKSVEGHGSNAIRVNDCRFSRKEPHCNDCLQRCCLAFHFCPLERSVLVLLLQTLHKLLVLFQSCCNLLVLSFNLLHCGGLYPLPMHLPDTCYWSMYGVPLFPDFCLLQARRSHVHELFNLLLVLGTHSQTRDKESPSWWRGCIDLRCQSLIHSLLVYS